MKHSASGFARHFFRAYRNGPIRIGHSFIRHFFGPILDKQQTIQLRSGLKLILDLSKGNQNAIFWNDEDGGLHLSWAIRELVPLNGLFLDCGANCGLIGLLAHQYRMARVIFIEPHPRLAKSILENIRINNFGSSCELIETAVSDLGGDISFYEDLKNDGGHSVHVDSEDRDKRCFIGKVKCLTLKTIIEERNLSKIHFLKIDTEGNDFNVLTSLGDLLQPSLIEVLFVEMTQNQEAICNLMHTNGYIGFICTTHKRRQTMRLRSIYGSGGSVCVFEPLNKEFVPNGDVLWCGNNSNQAAYLKRLYSNQHQ